MIMTGAVVSSLLVLSDNIKEKPSFLFPLLHFLDQRNIIALSQLRIDEHGGIQLWERFFLRQDYHSVLMRNVPLDIPMQ